MHPLGFLRVSAASPEVTVADPAANMASILACAATLSDSDLIVFPELSICGYTCGDLFGQSLLLDKSVEALGRIVASSHGVEQLWAVGLPLVVQGRLLNVAAMIANGKLLGLVPKQYLPNYLEFYEQRWFHSGSESVPDSMMIDGLGEVPIGCDLLFECGEAKIGVEICEDLWMPVPPSSLQALAGANVLLNLSASNETVGKARYRSNLVTSQSGRCIAAYIYSSSGPSESTTDLVFGGHCMIAEGGSMLVERRFGDGSGPTITTDIDLRRIDHDRRLTGTFHDGLRVLPEGYSPRRIGFSLRSEPSSLVRQYAGNPFIPSAADELEHRCHEIFEIQCAGLSKRVSQIPSTVPLSIGVSGGLDSTLALLAAVRMADGMLIDRKRIHGLSLPGFGTSQGTRINAADLMRLLEIQSDEIDIRENCLQNFRDLKHSPFGIDIDGHSVASFQKTIEQLPDHHRSDLTFENVQARVRTLLLMSRGFVLGTGDLSETALGWSTYNADHMSMYNVNCSIPKTLVRFLVRYIAEHYFEGETRRVLLAIIDTPISPELLPLSQDGKITQSTEATVGAYELHDFFLYHFIRTGSSPDRLLLLSEHAKFSRDYSESEIRQTLKLFLKRFFANQFKRSCVPDGPKVGSVSLSPRGDWRMPSDASVATWLDEFDN